MRGIVVIVVVTVEVLMEIVMVLMVMIGGVNSWIVNCHQQHERARREADTCVGTAAAAAANLILLQFLAQHFELRLEPLTLHGRLLNLLVRAFQFLS